ncbi:nif-specific transcriptional activator NifA [Burkholderia vietnamiensis]|uniref:nif-specific transcriptional activator NifA n=1 Tax=Burkholderia vietnamiensis TaxID=60552 RepID=UPI001B93F563|nr:nif-specific transcriptional activator NifA [Burkholderia vietnamiensis]MBR8229942.1 nif-specific transcriptional activator NifA [Burkholderia vietnamiensis]HDR8918879.1 nif-specific transcriptional activator NifA [Burkholderia vietnamiensis]HDR8977167.1 nif-specific transcriptional activator NifA [Burkholderia vietnamiensis]HDR9086202.1 nif-specific transcriptional activator NifA [Burkholderia vietnamiensis]
MPNSHASEHRRDLDVVYEVGKTLISSLDVSQTFLTSLRYLSYTLGWRSAFVVVVEPDGYLRGLCCTGLADDWRQRVRFLPGEGIVGRIFTSGSPVIVPEVRDEPLFLDRTGGAGEPDDGSVAMLGMPIRHEQRTLGVLVAFCSNPDRNRVFANDLYLMKIVATLMGQAMLLHRSVSCAHDRLQDEVRRMQKAIRPVQQLDQVVGVSAPMQQVFSQVHQVAPARTTVLLRGESGTGKEVIARAIHRLSPRNDHAFISVNCAALTETLLESELFGHEKGAFTGAQGLRKGRFELAHGGTLFLDEIGDISPSFQAKLLRVLQEREFERVGGAAPVKVDVRLILATNRNLERMVKEGEFRADLYYRINVVSIQLPPLRERRDDIPAMAQHFLDRFNRDNGRALRFSEDAMRVLTSCYWPGNVRELENCVERTATMTHHDMIDRLAFLCQEDRCLTKVLHHIEREDAVRPARLLDIPICEVPAPGAGDHRGLPRDGGFADDPFDDAFHEHEHDHDHDDAFAMNGDDEGKPEGERERLIWAMERCGWVQAKAARLLKITPRQIGYALHKYGIEVRRF